MERTNLFEFTDYRSFLKAQFEDTKKKNPKWSYGAWTKKLGLKNATSLTKIINGQREAGSEITAKLCGYFKFSATEEQYFEDLIRISKSQKDPERIEYLLERLRKVSRRPGFWILNEEQFSAISHWWFYAIRRMIFLKDFQDDPKWIAQNLRFKVTATQIRRALDILLKNGFLKRDPQTHILKLGQVSLNTSDDLSSEGLKRFHEGVLDIARESIRSTSPEEREISGLTLSVSADKVPEAKKWLRKMQDEFSDLFAAREKSDSVYQFETLFFPLTQNKPISNRHKGDKK